MNFTFSDQPQQITVHHFAAGNGEFLSSSEETIPAHTGLPAESTAIEPPAEREGYARVYQAGAWVQLEDHRDSTVYLKATREAFVVEEIGALLDTVTTIAPASDYDVWNTVTGAWEEDTAAKLADETEAAEMQKLELMREASQQIEILDDGAEHALELVTHVDILLLAAWKKYRFELNKVSTADPANIVWPEVPTPESVAAEAEAATAAAQAAAAAASGSQSEETAETDTNAQA